jgi:four helix bundle protein
MCCALRGDVDDALSDDELPQAYESGQDIRDRAFVFACRVVKFSQEIYDAGGVGRMLVPQLVNCSTSVPAMLEEARAAESRRDFISKCCISLKECRESWVRLRVCEACRIGPANESNSLAREAHEIVSIVGAIVRNARRNSASTAKFSSRIPNS